MCYSKTTNRREALRMETVNLFGAQRGRAAQAAAWAMEKERFSTQEMANALAVSTPTAITLLRRLEDVYKRQAQVWARCLTALHRVRRKPPPKAWATL